MLQNIPLCIIAFYPHQQPQLHINKKSLELKQEIRLVCIQETIPRVPLRAVYKTSCWPSYWLPAQEALTFNWPPVCFELHPPITISHKRGTIKLNCTWASREGERDRPSESCSAANAINRSAESTPHISLSYGNPYLGTHTSLHPEPISIWHLFKCPPS